jgi:Fe-S cluster assembly protein SufD
VKASSQTATQDRLSAVRADAASVLRTLTFPGRKDEAWRRTDLSSLGAAQIVAPQSSSAASAELLAEFTDESSAGMRLVLVDGRIDAALSDVSALPEGVHVGGLQEGEDGSDSVQAALGVLTQPLPEAGADPRTSLGVHTFAALNQASVADVVCIHVPPGVAVERPLHVLVFSTGVAKEGSGRVAASELAASHPSLVISVCEGASLHMLQQYAGTGAYFTNALTRAIIEEGASLQHSYLQEQNDEAVHVDSIMVEVASGATYDSVVLQSGSRIARVNQAVRLDGPAAHSELRGLSLASEAQLSDLHSAVIHVRTHLFHSAKSDTLSCSAQASHLLLPPHSMQASPDCTSEQEQRNAVADRARVVFRGNVRVPQGADNTTAAQLCRSLLLSDNARVDIQPTLEIDTDDVVCTHGATVSDLEEEMIFYLQARGLSRLQARALLLEGWARDALSKVPSMGAKERAAAKASTLAPDEGRAVRRGGFQSI